MYEMRDQSYEIASGQVTSDQSLSSDQSEAAKNKTKSFTLKNPMRRKIIEKDIGCWWFTRLLYLSLKGANYKVEDDELPFFSQSEFISPSSMSCLLFVSYIGYL